MEFDAVILAGGRSSRLGGVPKSGLEYDGATLLERALQAARGARAAVVVGPPQQGLRPGTLTAREDPPFAGPAAAIAAGLAALAGRPAAPGSAAETAPWTLVLACDMPHARDAVAVLIRELEGSPGAEGAMAISADGRRQPLLGLYSTAALEREVAAAHDSGGLVNASVFGLLARLELLPVPVPSGSTDDVDTWEDAAALGIDGPRRTS
ncbi:molybdenum cofactor guanylyltransferase [Arthrobacter cavernae]|uniref:NTP transferase domain-containing protein n=1 Tax=Arthrobacter cavernae TaxID=2817681 RepID=A0A939KLU4_9MICC|nr:NTP transferase domain-containing protein [Arthrobacter cavernae]MBO1267526.1 NTP transferase domain-containing protein [Arthrobacter cavernae]